MKMRKKGLTCLIIVCMIVALIPGSAFAAGQTTTSGKLVIMDRQFEIAPDISEREYVTNNSELTAQQSGHVLEVKTGDNAQIIAGYKDYAIESIKSGKNWGMERTTTQAQNAETRRKVNVVGAVNADFFDMSNGRPSGVLIMNGTVIQKTDRPCFYIDNAGKPHISASSANLPDDTKEAVGGATVIVSDGQAINTGDTTKNPRTCIGIKADDTVVIYMVDGRQAPLSIGMDYAELAQTMIDLGCVTALNLDGGGSSTFATQRAGDVIANNDKQAGLTLRCSPSDGYERTVSSSLLVVSTAKADGKFDHAIISPSQEVYTPGSTIAFTAQGADKSGAVVGLPSGLSWKVDNSEFGTIDNNGKFIAAAGKTGTVKISLEKDGKEVGSTAVELQWPDKLGFTNSSVSLDFGETSDLSFNPTYNGRKVHYKAGDFEWSVEPESYKHSIPVEKYRYEKWANPREMLLSIVISGAIGSTKTVQYNNANYTVYSSEYEETSREIAKTDDGTINVTETVRFKGAKKYRFDNGKFLLNINEDIANGKYEGLGEADYYSVTGIEATKTVTFPIGRFNSDNTFTADEDSTLNGKVSVQLANDASVNSDIDVIVGMEPYVLMDFEDHIEKDTSGSVLSTTPAKDYWKIKVGKSPNAVEQDNYMSYLTSEEIKENLLWVRSAVDASMEWPENGNRIVSINEDQAVRFGDNACRLAWDFSKKVETAVAVSEFGFSGDLLVDTAKPTKIGMWINVPRDCKCTDSVLKSILKGKAVEIKKDDSAYYKKDDDGRYIPQDGQELGGTTTYVTFYSYDAEGNISGEKLSDWAGKGWTWVEADLSAFQMPIDLCRGYAVRIVSPQNHIKSDGYMYIDNLQFIFGTNTNDTNNPVIDSVTEKTSGSELKNANVPEFANSKPQFDIALSDSESTDKYATGIDANSIRIKIDGKDYAVNEKDVTTKGVLFQTQQLTNGEHSITIRVKDYFGNETNETYRFKINDEKAAVAAIRVEPQGESAEIGKAFTLNVNNISSNMAEFVDKAEVTIAVPEEYGKAIKDKLDSHIRYGSLYEKVKNANYSEGKITLYAKKKDTSKATADDKDSNANSIIASIDFPIPDSAKLDDKFNYAAHGSYTTGGGGYDYTFSQGEQKISLSAEYTITAEQAIVGVPVKFTVIDKAGKPAGENIDIYKGEEKLDNPHTFTTPGRFTVYAKDAEGKRSWNTDIVVSNLGTDGEGKPYGIQNNGSKDGSTMRNITWLAAINSSKNKAVIKYGDAENALDKTLEGTCRLFSFVETTQGEAYRLNSVSLTGLQPEKTYYYQVGDGEKWSEVMSFTTAPKDRSADTKFFIFGDIQTDNTANLAAAIEKVKDGGYSFGIQTGDGIDNVTRFSNWRGYLNSINSKKMNSIDMIHTLGNHEYYGDGKGDISKGMFGLENSEQGGYYSYEYGSMYVGVINDGGDLLKALDEAKNDIKNTKCTWKALVMHQPIYGTEDMMKEEARQKVVAAIEDAGFDVVFSGDDHSYARTYPMKADKKLGEASRDGVVYYICGDLSSKDNKYENRDIFAKMMPHNEYGGMYMSVEASREKLVLTAYKYNGDLLDSYTIARTDCELGKHSFDENSVYDVDDQSVTCKLCQKKVKAADSKYTGKLKAKGDKGEVMLVNGVAKTGWFPLGDKICHAGDNGILHKTTTVDTATCLKNGYLKSTCECGAEYKGSSTWGKGHSWDETHVCTVCHAVGKNIENVTFDIENKFWEYTGTAIRAAIPVKDGDYTLSASSSRYGKDAYKSYSNNVNVGKGKVTFEGRGDYYGSKTVEFPIVPKSVKEITVGDVYSNSATIKWDEAAGAGYYRVYMRTSGTDWKLFKKTEETNIIVDNLKPNTKYFFLVASSTDVEGETYNCLRWSNELSITTPARDPNTSASQINSIKAKLGDVEINEVVKGGEHYLILPASADMTKLNLVLGLKGEHSKITYSGGADAIDGGNDATIDVTKLTGKSGGNGFDLRIAVENRDPLTLHILKSMSTSSIHLTSANAKEQGRKYVDAVKGNVATGRMRMIGANGQSIYDGNLKQIKARGNSTFQYYDKKSYQIKLENGTDLLNKAEEVKTWVLLAGYGDATQMHDKLFKDMAAALGMSYVANCDWVDLYYDGEYRGVYLLSEKNSVGNTGINITDMEKAYGEKNENYSSLGKDTKANKGLNDYGQEYLYIEGLKEPDNITGGYLIERNLETIDEICGFYTKKGSGFNVKSPEFAGKDAMKYISEYYQEFEDAVYSKDGYNAKTGKYYYDYCDVDSLVKVYLLQKLGYNVDGFRSSFYFYKDKDGKMYAGPVWDQEMTLGTGWTEKINADDITYNYLEEALIKIPDFQNRVKEYYKSTFKNQMTSLLGDEGIVSGYYNKISPNADMNYVLWPYVRIGYPKASGHLWPSGTNYKMVVDDMRDWIAARADKLDKLYGDGTLHMHHNYVEEITKEATYDEEGLKTFTCSVCKHSYTEVIPKLVRPSSGGGLVVPGTEPGKTDKAENIEIKPNTEVKKNEDGKNVTVAEISKEEGSKLVKDAISNDSEEAVINVTTKTGEIDGAEITLNGNTLSEFAEKTSTVLVIKSDKTEVALDNIALSAIAIQAGENKVTLVVQIVKSDDKVCEVELKIISADGTIKDFKGGKVKVTLEINDNLKKNKPVCVYIDENDIYHKVKSGLNKNGKFEFTTGHFSRYAVMAEAEANKIISKQLKKMISDVKIKMSTKKTAKGNIRVSAKVDIKALRNAGYNVKYKFYRSTKAKSNYKVVKVKASNSFIDSKIKKGNKYYYKVKLMVYDENNKLAGSTALKKSPHSKAVKVMKAAKAKVH